MKIYIVSGQTGDHSDSREWDVRAFLSAEKAVVFQKMANEWCESNNLHERTAATRSWYAFENDPKPSFDPKFDCDRTGTRYVVTEVELDGYIPQGLDAVAILADFVEECGSPEIAEQMRRKFLPVPETVLSEQE